MHEPKTPTQQTTDDEALYVSPLFDDTIAERYAQVQKWEAELGDAEIIRRLRQSKLLLDDTSRDEIDS